MTANDWRLCVIPQPMLLEFPGTPSERKLRLFGCAVCHRIWELMDDARCRKAVEASEQYADGFLAERALDNISADAEFAWDQAIREPGGDDRVDARLARAASYSSSPWLSLDVLMEGVNAAAEVAPGGAVNERHAQANLLRDIFGNPFRSVDFNPAWRTSDVLLLAQGIYDDRAFDRMPILADALQDAGCDNDDILNHCRDTNQVHVRGCWVVDLVLGKK